MFALAVLAGAFIACGAILATIVTTGLSAAGMGFGLVKLLGGLVFCLGLVADVVAAAELVTGNNLIVMAFACGGVIPTRRLFDYGLLMVQEPRGYSVLPMTACPKTHSNLAVLTHEHDSDRTHGSRLGFDGSVSYGIIVPVV